MEKLKVLSDKCGRGKGEASNLQFDLEPSFNTIETKRATAMEWNNQLASHLVRVKEGLQKSLKWSSSSKFHANLTIQGQNDRKVLLNSSKSPSYNIHGKDVPMFNSLLYLHYGRDGHLKKDCISCKSTQDNLLKYSKQRNWKSKGPGQQTSKMKRGIGQHKSNWKKGPGQRKIGRRRVLFIRRRDLVVLLFLSWKLSIYLTGKIIWSSLLYHLTGKSN